MDGNNMMRLIKKVCLGVLIALMVCSSVGNYLLPNMLTTHAEESEASETLGEVIAPLAKYEFRDAENPGKDSMGNYDLVIKVLPDAENGNVTVDNGVATFDGSSALIPSSNEDDISEDLESFTVAFEIQAPETPSGGWSTPVGFGWNDWTATKWGNFHIAPEDSNYLLRFSTHSDGGAEAYWGSELGTLSSEYYSTVILSAQLGEKMTVYLDNIKVYEKDLPSDYSIKDEQMRFAIGGSSTWGNVYDAFSGSLADVRVYDFAFDKAQIAQYLLTEDVYQDLGTELEETVRPLAKYEFQDATNPGKDTMGNYDLVTTFLPDAETGNVTVHNGSATFDGTAALIPGSNENDISEVLESFTVAFEIQAPETPSSGWSTPVGFGWNAWTVEEGLTKWGNFHIAPDDTSSLLRFSTHSDGSTDAYWGSELGRISVRKYSKVILSAQSGGKMTIYLDGVKVYEKDLPAEYSLQDANMRFAIGGSSTWGNVYDAFVGSLSDVRVYDFAFDKTQIVQYLVREDVYESSDIIREVIDPLAKYEFRDATNPGKDTMGNYDLVTTFLPEGETGNIVVSNGVATFDGTAALIPSSNENDISEVLESFTVAFEIQASEIPSSGWSTPVGFGWNAWTVEEGLTKWGNFHIAPGDTSSLLRFSTYSDGSTEAYWGSEIGTLSAEEYSTVILSAQLNGKMTVYLDGTKVYEKELPTEYSLQDADMRFAIGGSSTWGNVYDVFTGSLSDVRVYSFAFDEMQIERYMNAGDVYTEKVVQEFTAKEYATYRAGGAGNYTAPTAPDGYVFGGWFSDSTCEAALTENTIADGTCVYAKFVDADILSVKCQIPVTTTMDDEETTLRVVTAVDSLKYSLAGFEVLVEGDEESTLYTTRDAYTDIQAKIGGATITYKPYELSKEARYFMAVEITKVPNNVFTKNITITPAWKTLDGTIVTAPENCRSDINIAEAIASNATAFTAISYEAIPTVEDMDAYYSEVKNGNKSNDNPVENGVVTCPYYTLKINDVDVPVYSTRCGRSVHSFAWIDIDEAETDIVLNVRLSLQNMYDKVVVLPQSSNVVPKMESNVVSAQITSLGSFSFAFDDDIEEALTIYVAREEKLDVPSGYEIQEFEPATYSASNTTFTSENTVYYFKKGVYGISSISLPSNSMLYFESGTYVDVITEGAEDTHAAIRSYDTENVKVCGRALFDFSQSQGGASKIKGVYDFTNVDTARFSGITTINSNSWSVCFTDCNDVVVENNMLLGYRTYSDGIMISDCQDVLVRNNFVRTGDDAIEVKSTGHEGTENIIYEYNDVWTDKARAYGCIYECNNSMKNVVFRNNSVGFAMSTWSDKLGCCAVIMGNNAETTWEDIHFENMEIYYSNHALITIDLEDSSADGTGGGQAQNLYFKNIYAYQGNGLAVRIDVDSASNLDKVYLDNVHFNEEILQAGDIGTSENILITHYDSAWLPSEHILVNTLIED